MPIKAQITTTIITIPLSLKIFHQLIILMLIYLGIHTEYGIKVYYFLDNIHFFLYLVFEYLV